MKIKALILAGGSGTRFWPKSTKEKPKQFLKITSDKTMIQETFDRISKLVKAENIFVVSNKNHSNHVHEQLNLPKENVILEPNAKNTAAAIALGILNMNDEDVVIALPSDHYIKDVDTYIKILKIAVDFSSKNDAIVTLGIKPNKPETGYGYIEVDKTNETVIGGLTRNLDSHDVSSTDADKTVVENDKTVSEVGESVIPNLIRNLIPLKVKRFHEKPNLETAYQYLESGNFFWNSGMFIFKVSTMWKAFKKHMPALYKAFKSVKTNEEMATIYSSLESISMDYGVMERADNIYVIPSDFGWSDVGSWDALYKLAKKDKNGNYAQGKVIFRDATPIILPNREALIYFFYSLSS